MAVTINLVAPNATPGLQFQTSKGNVYTSNFNGIIANVPIGDIVNLLNDGCTPQVVQNQGTNGFSTTSFTVGSSGFLNVDGTVLDATGGAGKFSRAVTVGTSFLVKGENALSSTKTDDLIFEFTMPAQYVPAQNFTMTVNAKINGAGTPGTATVQLKAYLINGTSGAATSNLIANATQALTTTAADFDFVIVGATLQPGYKLLFVLETVLQETAGTNINAQINSLRYK